MPPVKTKNSVSKCTACGNFVRLAYASNLIGVLCFMTSGCIIWFLFLRSGSSNALTTKANHHLRYHWSVFEKKKKAVFKTSSYDCYFPFVSAAEKLLRSQSNVAPLYGFTIAGHSCYGTCTAMNCRLGHQMFKPGKQMPLIAHLSHPGSHLYHECLVYQMEGNSRVVNCTVR